MRSATPCCSFPVIQVAYLQTAPDPVAKVTRNAAICLTCCVRRTRNGPGSTREKLQAIDATLTGVSALTTVPDAAESRYASSDGAAQAAIAASVPNLQAAFNRERTLLDTEKARLDQERRDVDVLAAEIARQQQAVTQYTRA